MQTLSEIRALLAAKGRRPRHSLGQNFLHDQNMIRKLVSSAAPAPDELLLEIGPGTGALTEALLEKGARVLACEIDRDMVEILRERVEPRAGGRLRVIEGDCLDGKHALNAALRAELGDSSFRLVANLPYQAATPLIATLLERHQACTGLIVTIQREVAERLTAAPRSDAYGPISVIVQLLATVSTIATLPPGCFWPEPDVTSTMLSITPRPAPATLIDRAAFTAFVSRVFGKRRKQLGTILGRDAPLPPGIAPEQRPEELTPAQWLELCSLNQRPPRP